MLGAVQRGFAQIPLGGASAWRCSTRLLLSLGLPASRCSLGWAGTLLPGAGADPRRSSLRSTRLAMLSNNLTHWKKLPLLPSLTNQPHQVLASDPVPFADLQQVRGAGGKLCPAAGPWASLSAPWRCGD